MAAGIVCSYNRAGYCKFQDRCRNLHINEVFGLTGCSNDSCQLRHPRVCKYYSSYGACIYSDNCAYSHKNLLLDRVGFSSGTWEPSSQEIVYLAGNLE